jgi:hypothetical protein
MEMEFEISSLTQDDLSFLVSCVLPMLVMPCLPRGLSMLWDT